MPLKDRFRRALTISSRQGSTSHSNSSNDSNSPPSTPLGDHHPTQTQTNTSTTPTPSITLTKAPSRLTKTLTWNTHRREEKERKKISEWEHRDQEEWNAPSKGRSGRGKSKAHQDMLRAFTMQFSSGDGKEKGRGRPGLEEGRRRSWWSGSVGSGVSPRTSVDGERGVRRQGRKWSGGGLSREVSRTEGEVPGTVVEE